MAITLSCIYLHEIPCLKPPKNKKFLLDVSSRISPKLFPLPVPFNFCTFPSSLTQIITESKHRAQFLLFKLNLFFVVFRSEENLPAPSLLHCMRHARRQGCFVIIQAALSLLTVFKIPGERESKASGFVLLLDSLFSLRTLQ